MIRDARGNSRESLAPRCGEIANKRGNEGMASHAATSNEIGGEVRSSSFFHALIRRTRSSLGEYFRASQREIEQESFHCKFIALIHLCRKLGIIYIESIINAFCPDKSGNVIRSGGQKCVSLSSIVTR